MTSDFLMPFPPTECQTSVSLPFHFPKPSYPPKLRRGRRKWAGTNLMAERPHSRETAGA